MKINLPKMHLNLCRDGRLFSEMLQYWRVFFFFFFFFFICFFVCLFCFVFCFCLFVCLFPSRQSHLFCSLWRPGHSSKGAPKYITGATRYISLPVFSFASVTCSQFVPHSFCQWFSRLNPMIRASGRATTSSVVLMTP